MEKSKQSFSWDKEPVIYNHGLEINVLHTFNDLNDSAKSNHLTPNQRLFRFGRSYVRDMALNKYAIVDNKWTIETQDKKNQETAGLYGGVIFVNKQGNQEYIHAHGDKLFSFINILGFEISEVYDLRKIQNDLPASVAAINYNQFDFVYLCKNGLMIGKKATRNSVLDGKGNELLYGSHILIKNGNKIVSCSGKNLENEVILQAS